MDDKKLLKLMDKNPGQAIHELINRYGDSISTICRNFLYDCSEDDIEETIADTYIHFWQHREKFRLNEKYSLKSYLYAIEAGANLVRVGSAVFGERKYI